MNNDNGFMTAKILQAMFLTGKYEPWVTAEHLAAIRFSDGVTALHYAAREGNYAAQTNVEILIHTKDAQGLSALVTAASFGHLLPDTTVKDLLTPNESDERTALNALLFRLEENELLDDALGARIKRQIPILLHASMRIDGPNVQSITKMNEIGAAFSKIDRVATALWMASEMHKLQQLKLKSVPS